MIVGLWLREGDYTHSNDPAQGSLAYASVGDCPTENSANCRYIRGPLSRTITP